MRIALLVALLLLSGCFVNVRTVQVGYQYAGPTGDALSGRAVSVGRFVDMRGEEYPGMLVHMRNQSGAVTRSGWQAERPLAEIVREGLMEGLTAHGLLVRDAGAGTVLSGEIISYEHRVIQGFWSGTVDGVLTVRLQLMEESTGRILMRETVVGTGRVPGGRGVIQEAFRASLNDFVQRLASDEYFMRHLGSVPEPPS